MSPPPTVTVLSAANAPRLGSGSAAVGIREVCRRDVSGSVKGDFGAPLHIPELEARRFPDRISASAEPGSRPRHGAKVTVPSYRATTDPSGWKVIVPPDASVSTIRL